MSQSELASSEDLAPTSTPPSGGFVGQINGASVSDLIQMNCLNHSTCAVRVRSEQHLGYLYFESGQLVHAELGTATGEEAVFHMIGLASGTFEPCTRSQPRRHTISCSFEAILLRSAQRVDEEARVSRRHSRVHAKSATPSETSTAGVTIQRTVQVGRRPPDAPVERRQSPMREAAADPAAEPSVRPSHPNHADYSAVRVTSDGELLSARGKDTESLAETTAFATQLATHLGEELGLGVLSVIDLQGGAEQRAIIYREKPEQWLGVVGTPQRLAGIGKKVGAD